ncbi:hypothetical protein MED121_01275 [Marinomonas sp. MED121]|nr:hypothetical protein MED121_01275 [Marinomonas sp. MED121]
MLIWLIYFLGTSLGAFFYAFLFWLGVRYYFFAIKFQLSIKTF